MSLGLLNNIKLNGEKEKINNANVISFTAAKKQQAAPKVQLPKINVATPKELNPINLPGVPQDLATKIINAANESNASIADYLKSYMKHLVTKFEGVTPEASITAPVGKTNVTTLIDGKQIFAKVTEMIKSAENSIQIEMFEFQNLAVDGDIWPAKGAETLPGWGEQQKILEMLVAKKKANPKMNVQVILDAHKWYQDGLGNYKRHYSNQKMIKYLKEQGIDVVPYPRSIQGGTILQHAKFLAVDGKKVLLGGMNWGSHSVANHDACIAIETKDKNTSSEVDNIIDGIFNKDWAFAWQRLGNTQLIKGLEIKEGQEKAEGNAKYNFEKLQEEDRTYMEIVGAIFDKPEYKNRYKDNKLNLPKVNPVKTSTIQVLTNSPREYSVIGEAGAESIGDYIKKRLDTATSLRAELFVLSHEEIVNKIIKRHEEAKNGGKPFDCQILISPGILDDFPYCRKAYNALEAAGVPIRTYRVNKDLEQRLHCKWAVFDKSDLLIGSANWSAVGLENNLSTGQRPDYPLTNALLDKRIAEYKPRIDELEKELNLDSLYLPDTTVDYDSLKARRKGMKAELAKIEANDLDNVTLDLNKLDVAKKLLGYYNLIKIHEENKEKYKRGNHECAVVVPNKKVAGTFVNQFAKDWTHSEPRVPDGYNTGDQSTTVTEEMKKDSEGLAETYAEMSFMGKLHRVPVKSDSKKSIFNKVV